MAIKTQFDNLPLLRNGQEYISSSKQALQSIQGEKLLDVSFAPELHLQMAIPLNRRKGYSLLQNIPIDEVIDIFQEAGKIFFEDMLKQGLIRH